MAATNLIINNQVITSSGSSIFNIDYGREAVLFYNITGIITGSSPTIQFFIKEIDPSDRSTVIGQIVSTEQISTTGVGQLTLSLGTSPVISVSWIVGGVNPSFGGTNLALIAREAGNKVSSQLDGFFYSSYQPDPANYAISAGVSLSTDVSNRLEVHSTSTTDEGSFRDDFTGSSLTTALSGTLTFTNNSTSIIGSGTNFTTSVIAGQWIKKSTDNETFYANVSSVDSDTSITLSNVYTGTTTSGVSAVVSNYNTLTAIGGSITVSSSVINLASGTTSGQNTFIQRLGDYLPYTFQIYASVSQRIANQTIFFGFRDGYSSPIKRAEVQFTGTNNTQVNFVSSFGSAAADTQTTTITLPNSGTTATNHLYKIDLSGTQATLSIDGIIVAVNNQHIPGPYDSLNIFAGTTNTGTPSGSTTLAIDYIYFYNSDRVQIDTDFQSEPLPVQGYISPGQTVSGNPLLIGGSDGYTSVARYITAAIDRSTLTAGSATGIPIIGQSYGVGRIGRLSRLGHFAQTYQTLLAVDPIEGSTINSWLWTQSAATMTIAQATTILTLNNNSTTTNATYAIITSNKQFPTINQAPIVCSFKANIAQTTNAVQEIGFGAPTTNTAIINNGAFFRISSSGSISIVVSYNGAEKVSSGLGTLNSSSYYLFIVCFEDNGARFIIEDASGVPLLDTFLALALTTPDKVNATHIPAFARVYTVGGAAGTAPQTKITSFQVWQYDVNMAKPWSEQLGSAGRSANINPTTFAQTAQLAAGAAPSNITPNSTGSTAYTTLGGEFLLTSTASSENTLGVFAYQVPSPYNLVITDIILPPYFVSTVMGNTISFHEWCLMVASSNNPSTATGYRNTLGVFTAAASAAVGTVFNGQTINIGLKTPIVVLPGQYLLVLVKVISGPATGAYRGSILINGYYE